MGNQQVLTLWVIVQVLLRHNMKTPKISPRNKLRLSFFIELCIFFIGGIAISFLENVHARNVLLIVLFVVVLLVDLIVSLNIRCPQCKDIIIYQPSSRAFGMNGRYLFSNPCQHCGYDLDKTEYFKD